MDELKASVAVILGKTSRLEADVLSLLPFKRLFADVRERMFLTYLRDFWDDYGSSPHSKKRNFSNEAEEVKESISTLNRNILLHGGMAEADAIMFSFLDEEESPPPPDNQILNTRQTQNMTKKRALHCCSRRPTCNLQRDDKLVYTFNNILIESNIMTKHMTYYFILHYNLKFSKKKKKKKKKELHDPSESYIL